MPGLPFLWWLPIGRVPEITPQELHRQLAEGQPVQLIDARTAVEFDTGTIGAAKFAPLTGMPDSVKRIEFDPAKPIVALCLTGHRSRPAVRWLRARGLEAYSLQGGITAWKAAGYPLEPPAAEEKT
ncbi:MAG: rhodanese-like domain-containing protein [Anaerolineales bacterium]|jgi:rhodanese-related sulfurtransferase